MVGGAGKEGMGLDFTRPGQAPGAWAGGCRGALYGKALVLPGPSSNAGLIIAGRGRPLLPTEPTGISLFRQGLLVVLPVPSPSQPPRQFLVARQLPRGQGGCGQGVCPDPPSLSQKITPYPPAPANPLPRYPRPLSLAHLHAPTHPHFHLQPAVRKEVFLPGSLSPPPPRHPAALGGEGGHPAPAPSPLGLPEKPCIFWA